jgi:hypothetical protein
MIGEGNQERKAHSTLSTETKKKKKKKYSELMETAQFSVPSSNNQAPMAHPQPCSTAVLALTYSPLPP